MHRIHTKYSPKTNLPPEKWCFKYYFHFEHGPFSRRHAFIFWGGIRPTNEVDMVGVSFWWLTTRCECGGLVGLKQKAGNGRKYMEIHERNCCMFVSHVVLQQVHCKSLFIVHHEEIQRSLQQRFPTFPSRPKVASVKPIITIIAIVISTTTMHGHNCHCSMIQHQKSLSNVYQYSRMVCQESMSLPQAPHISSV